MKLLWTVFLVVVVAVSSQAEQATNKTLVTDCPFPQTPCPGNTCCPNQYGVCCLRGSNLTFYIYLNVYKTRS